MKSERQKAVLKIVGEESIETQSELAQRLRDKGFKVTQATVSRDIKDLGLVKVPGSENKYRYALPPDHRMANVFGRLERMFRDSVVRFDDSENMVVIRTLPGTAHAVASCIDTIAWPEIIGTVAGDDTILVIVKPKEAVGAVLERFNSLM